jgi:hypothetical protein
MLKKHGLIRHTGEGWYPAPLFNWVPAFAGTTKLNKSAFPLSFLAVHRH